MKQIPIETIENIKIGHYTNEKGATGCTVVICENGAPAGLDVRGGGPASRETELLKPYANTDKVHAILLSGGSAFGLDAAGGVMQYLEKHKIGFDVGVTKVPLVCESCLFDLSVGDVYSRPIKESGYFACVDAYNDQPIKWGNVGAGTGASVGKLKGMQYAMKSGIGSYAVQNGDLKIGAIVAVNALGDIYNYHNGNIIAGLLNNNKDGFISTYKEMIKSVKIIENKFTTNTTIGIIITNAKFNKQQLSKIASMTHNGYARSIKPLHTTADGDSIYAMSTGNVKADIDVVGSLAADIMSEAIINAVEGAKAAYGLKSIKEIRR